MEYEAAKASQACGAATLARYEQGFYVTLAKNGMTDTRPEAHDYSIKNVSSKPGETRTSQKIIDLLPGRRS
jgi:hypothetical protein